ncbi:MAG: TetR family transcriptional regulator, partial [Lachnospiraceae bacterium]|nr:TetR family transcriptional regulator [Lachnospiraceae bacterium]
MSNSKITARAIKDAFLAELNDRPLSKISVKDISDRCGINRNTFYYHYDNVP